MVWQIFQIRRNVKLVLYSPSHSIIDLLKINVCWIVDLFQDLVLVKRGLDIINIIWLSKPKVENNHCNEADNPVLLAHLSL